MSLIFHNVFFEPLYNALVFLGAHLPGQNLGLAIIILTLVVKFILFPLQHRMSRTQVKLKELEPTIKDLKVKYEKDTTEQAKQLMLLYREHGINPFSGFVVLLIQIPILLALFYVFRDSFTIHGDYLYSFVTAPASFSLNFFGLDIATPSLWLGVVAGVTQFFQARLMSQPVGAGKAPTKTQPDFARAMEMQMKYFLPVLVIVFSLGLPGAITLYWITSNLFAIGHSLVVRREARNLLASRASTS